MKTLSKMGIRMVHSAIDSLFDRIKARVLGHDYFKTRGDKTMVFMGRPELTIPGIYKMAAAEESTKGDETVENSLVKVVEAYLDAQRETTKAKVVHSVGSWLHDAAKAGVKTDIQTVLGGQLADVWGKTTHDVTRIVDTEATRARNMGTLEGISKINSSAGIEDPTVFFVVVRDGERCDECTTLHLMPDKVTPRAWKLSQVSSGYHKRGEETPSIGGLHPHCFTSGTRLHTQHGLLTVKELYDLGGALDVVVDARIKNRRVGNNQFGAEIPGETWLWRHKSGSQIRKATAVYDTGVRDCVRVTLDTGISLEVSEEHEMWVDDGGKGRKSPASSLVPGDKIPLLSGEGLWGSDSFPELAELMGNLLGDGVLGQQTASWHFFGDDIPYGASLLERARPFAGSNLSTELNVRPPCDKYQVPSAVFNSSQIKDLFVSEFGLSKTPRRIPARMWAADRRTVCAFLRGLYAADGHTDALPSVTLAQNDLEFLQEIQLLLSNFGIRSRIFTHGEETIQKDITYADGTIHTTTRKPCFRLIVGGWDQVCLFAASIGMGVPRKQTELMSRLNATAENTKHGAWRTARVVSVEPIGAHQTYCLTEPMANTVTANGIVVGQCRCSIATLMRGFGFSGSGMIKYIAPGHDEYAAQRG